MFLAAAVICLLLLLRPLLKRLETLAVAAELAAKSLDKASVEFEQASAIINTELPDTLDSVERASLEFEELGQSLNGLTGGLKRSRPLATRQRGRKADVEAGEAVAAVKDAERGQDKGPVGAIQASTANSMRKVAQDISALTAALTPAMEAWRKRISFISELFEAAASKEGSPSSKPAKLPAPAVAVSATEKDRTAKNIEIGKSWIAEWRKQQQQLADSSGQGLEAQDVSQAANDLVQVASEAAAVASSSLPVIGADASDPQAQRGADLLQRAATAAQLLTEEAASTAASEVDGPCDPEGAGDLSPQDGDPQPPKTLERDSEADGEARQREEALEERRRAAQAVFAALAKAEEAASAAAAAGGELESALQQAEQHAGGTWWGWNPTGHTSSRKNGSASKQGLLENQEGDGMAYPSSPFIAATRTLDLDVEEGAKSPTPRKAGPVAAK